MAAKDHPDPWLIAEELCFRGAHDAAAAFAAAVPDERLAAYVESRREKEVDREVRRAVGAAQRLRIANYAKEAWQVLKKAEPPDDPVLEIRLCTGRAKVLRDLDKHGDSDRWFLEAGKLAHKLGWPRRTTESLCYVAYRYCFGTEGGSSEMWLIRRKLEQGEAAVVYGRPLRDLLAAVITAERTWYVPLGELAPIEAALAEFRVPRAGVPVLADELQARLVGPLGLGNEIERVLVVPVRPFIDMPWVLLFGDRAVVHGRDVSRVTPFGDWVPDPHTEARDGPYGEGVLAVGRPRREGGTGAEQEARAVGDTVLVGDQTTWAVVEEAADERPHWRALHIACPRTVAERWSRHNVGELGKFWTRRRAWLGEPEPELVVLSVHESLRAVWKPESARGPHLRAPRVIVSLWDVDPAATRVLMRRFYDLWNGKISLPACTALKLAQEFVRSHPAWRHPYYWAGWQLWAARPGEGGS